jgi:hypothetical protein
MSRSVASSEGSRFARVLAEQRERVARGVCACGCGERLPVERRRGTRFQDERHRQRAYRARVDAAAADAGLPANRGVLTLEAVRQARATGTRNDDARKPARARQARRREGVSVYLPSVELAEQVRALLARHGKSVRPAVESFDRALSRRRARDGKSSGE